MAAELNAKLRIDTSQFMAGLTSIVDASRRAGEQVKQGVGGKVPPPDTKAAAAAFSAIGRSAAEAVEEQKRALAALVASGQKGSSAYDDVKRALIESTAAAKKLDDAMAEVNAELGELGKKAQSVGAQLKSGIGDALMGGLAGGIIGGGIAGLATTAIGAIQSAATAAFDEYRALDKNIQNIGTLGVEAAGLSLQKFESLITDLSTRTPDTASNIANGVYNAISAGISGTEQEIVKFVETASKVAVAGLSDTNAAVNGLTSVVNAYGKGAEGAEEASNVFFAAIKAGKTSFNELNAGLANVIPAASAAGIQFDEVGASIAKLTTVGIPTAQATTQLRQAIIELQKPAKPLEEVLKRVGLSAANMGEQLKKPASEGGGLINTLQLVQKEAERSGLSLTQVFGSAEAASAALSLTGKNAESALAIFKSVQADVADGVAEKAFQSASKSLDVQFAIVKNNIQAAFNNIFSAVVPVITRVVDIITRTVGPALSQAFDQVGGVIKNVWTIVAPILGLIAGAIMTQVVATINYVANLIKLAGRIINTVFEAVKRAAQPVIDAFGDIGGAVDIDPIELFTQALSGAMEVMGLVFDVIGDLVEVVVELAVTGFQFLSKMVAEVVKLFKGSNDETKAAKGAATALINPMDKVREVFANIRGTIAGVIAVMREVKEVMFEFFDALRNLDVNRIQALFKGFGQRISSAYDSGFNSVAAEKAAEEAKKAAEAAERAAQEQEEQRSDAAKKREADDRTALQRAKERYEYESRQIDLQAKAFETAALRRAAEAGRDKLSDEEALDVAREKLRLEQQREKVYQRIFKVVRNGDGAVVSLGVKLAEKDGDRNKVVQDVRSIAEELSRQQVQLRLQIGADGLRQGAKDFRAFTDAVKGDLDRVNADIRENLTVDRFVADVFAFKSAQTAADESLTRLRDTIRRRLAEAIDPEQVKQLNDLLAKLNDTTNAAAKAAAAAEEKGRIETLRRIANLELDERKRRLLLDELAVEEKYARELELVKGSAERTAQVIAERDAKLKALRDEYLRDTDAAVRISEKAAAKITAAYQKAEAERTKLASKEYEERRKQIAAEGDKLIKQYKRGEIAAAQFAEQRIALNRKAQEAATPKSAIDVLLGETAKAATTVAIDEFDKMAKKAKDIFGQMAADGGVSFEHLGQMAIAQIGGSLARAVEDGTLSLGTLLRAVGDAAASALDMLAPVISAQYLGFLGPFALPASLVVVAALKALLSAAMGSIGAESGVIGIDANYRKRAGRTDTIPLRVAPGESIITRRGTERYGDALAEINRGRLTAATALKYVSDAELERALGLKAMGITLSRDAGKPIAVMPDVVRMQDALRTMQATNAALISEVHALRAEVRSLRGSIAGTLTAEVAVHTPSPNDLFAASAKAARFHTRRL